MGNTRPDAIGWSEFATDAPTLAAFGLLRLERRVAYLATIRLDGSPRVHPVSPFIGNGCLLVYMEPGSPKAADLRRDARYALHCGVEDDTGGSGEFHATGIAREKIHVPDRDEAFAAARAAGYRPAERHVVFELRVARVLATTYDGGPKRERWPRFSCR